MRSPWVRFPGTLNRKGSRPRSADRHGTDLEHNLDPPPRVQRTTVRGRILEFLASLVARHAVVIPELSCGSRQMFIPCSSPAWHSRVHFSTTVGNGEVNSRTRTTGAGSIALQQDARRRRCSRPLRAHRTAFIGHPRISALANTICRPRSKRRGEIPPIAW